MIQAWTNRFKKKSSERYIKSIGSVVFEKTTVDMFVSRRTFISQLTYFSVLPSMFEKTILTYWPSWNDWGRKYLLQQNLW